MRSIILTATMCVFLPALAWADTATVTSGQKTQIALHSRFDSQCQAARVEITVLNAAANGTVTSASVDYVIPAQNRAGEKQPAQCVGKTIKGMAVYYQSKAGFVGTDRFRYRRVTAGRSDDRFNAEIGYTITVK
jgi:hypothetical protein